MKELKKPRKVITRLEVVWILGLIILILSVPIIDAIFIKSETLSYKALRCDTTTHKLPVIGLYTSVEVNAMQKLYEARKHPVTGEGFRDTIYRYKGQGYIYYGHLLLKSDNVKLHQDSAYADSLLKQDVRRAFVENKRIYEATLYRNLKSIFMSGKPFMK